MWENSEEHKECPEGKNYNLKESAQRLDCEERRRSGVSEQWSDVEETQVDEQ